MIFTLKTYNFNDVQQKFTYHKNVLTREHNELSMQVFHGTEIVLALFHGTEIVSIETNFVILSLFP